MRLLVGANRGDDFGPKALGQLDCGHSEPAGPSLNKDRVASFHSAFDTKAEVGRRNGFGDGYGFDEAEGLWHWQDHAFGHSHLLRIAAAAQQGADLVATLPTAVGRSLGDDASGR